MPSDSVAIDLHKVQTLFQAIDHYLVAQESHSPDAPELESADLGTEFTDFAVPLRDHYAQLHADQVAHVAALREACAAARPGGRGGCGPHAPLFPPTRGGGRGSAGPFLLVQLLLWVKLLAVPTASQRRSTDYVLWLSVRKLPILINF